MIIPKPDTEYSRGILLEFKFAPADSSESQLNTLAEQALGQITEQKYLTEMQTQSQVQHTLGLGLAFSAKQVLRCRRSK